MTNKQVQWHNRLNVPEAWSVYTSFNVQITQIIERCGCICLSVCVRVSVSQRMCACVCSCVYLCACCVSLSAETHDCKLVCRVCVCVLRYVCTSKCVYSCDREIIVRFFLSEGQVVIMLVFDPMILTDLSKYTADLSRPGTSSSNQHPHLAHCVCVCMCVFEREKETFCLSLRVSVSASLS